MNQKNGFFTWQTVECDDEGLPVRLLGHVRPAFPLLEMVKLELLYLSSFFETQRVDMDALREKTGADIPMILMNLSNLNLVDIERFLKALRLQEDVILKSGIPIKPFVRKTGWEGILHPSEHIQHMRGTCENCFYCRNEDLRE